MGGSGKIVYDVIWTKKFKKSFKLAEKRGLPIQELKDIVEKLRHDEVLEPKYKDHELTGTFKGTRELHILPDWLLFYRKTKVKNKQILTLTLTLVDTGTHSDLFGK